MFYVAPDGKILDDGLGSEHAPYALDPQGQRHAVPPQIAAVLSARFTAQARSAPAPSPMPAPPSVPMPFSPQEVQAMRSMFPIGDLVARLTSSVGIEPCEPCKRRQDMLNSIGDRFARRFWG